MDKQNLLFVILSEVKYPKKYPKMQTQMCKILWIFRFLAKPQYDRGTVQAAIPSLRENPQGFSWQSIKNKIKKWIASLWLKPLPRNDGGVESVLYCICLPQNQASKSQNNLLSLQKSLLQNNSPLQNHTNP